MTVPLCGVDLVSNISMVLLYSFCKQFQARKLSTRETLSAANMTPSDSNFPEDKTVHCQNNNKSAVQNTGEVRVRKVSDIKTLSESVTARKSSGSAAESFDPPPSAKSFPSSTKSPSRQSYIFVEGEEIMIKKEKNIIKRKWERKKNVIFSHFVNLKNQREGIGIYVIVLILNVTQKIRKR